MQELLQILSYFLLLVSYFDPYVFLWMFSCVLLTWLLGSVPVISGVIIVSCVTIVFLSLFSVQIFSTVLRRKNLTLTDFTQLKDILCFLKSVILNYGRVNSICMLSCLCLPECLLRYE